MTIFKRDVLDQIVKYLNTNDIIVLHGARQVGKTHILFYLKHLLEEKKEPCRYLDLEDTRLIQILDAGHEEFIHFLNEDGFELDTVAQQNKKVFVLIDEIQYLQNPSSFLKILADHYPHLKLIVSGSSSFNIKTKFKDSLVGRTVNFDIFNLSFHEFLVFKGVHLDETHKLKPSKKKEAELKELFTEYTLTGGYPKIALTADRDMKEKYLLQIIDTYIKKDIRDLAAIKDIDKFNKLLEVLSAQSGQLLNVTELANTCGLAKQTVETYLFLLEQTYIIKRVRPYSTNLRSELFKTPKIFFHDTGLMQMLWLKELPAKILGAVFETCIFTELAKKYGSESVFFWRTTDKKEIDFILRRKNELLPIEVKLNLHQFKLGAVRYFMEKYKLKNYQVLGLEGKTDNPSFLYPWQV